MNAQHKSSFYKFFRGRAVGGRKFGPPNLRFEVSIAPLAPPWIGPCQLIRNILPQISFGFINSFVLICERENEPSSFIPIMQAGLN